MSSKPHPIREGQTKGNQKPNTTTTTTQAPPPPPAPPRPNK